jgi:polysaccharide export outer membrane protein
LQAGFEAVRRRLLIGIALGILITCGCSPAPSNYPYAQEPDPRKTECVIGVPDMLRIRVWRHSDLDTQVQVRADGSITMPLIGDVPAAGRTPTQVKMELSKRLANYIKSTETELTVEVVEIRSYRVTVSGNVDKPGVLQTPRYLTVGEAIALSGGPNRFADPERVEIVRTRGDGNVVRIPIRYDQLMKGLALEQDIVLLRDDLVYMP